MGKVLDMLVPKICDDSLGRMFFTELAEGKVSWFRPRLEEGENSSSMFWTYPALDQGRGYAGWTTLGIPNVVWWRSVSPSPVGRRHGLAVRTPSGEWKGYYETSTDLLELSYIELSSMEVTSVFRVMLWENTPSILLLNKEVGSVSDLVLMGMTEPSKKGRRVIQLDK